MNGKTPAKQGGRRVFFAALPETHTRRQLEAGLKVLSARPGRRVPANNLHLTLAFVGAVSEERLACLRERARRVDAPDIAMNLNRLGCFSRAGGLWLGPEVVPADLATLAQALSSVLADCGTVPEARAFAPHVTLARLLRNVPPGLALPPVAWHSHGFALMESVSGEHGVRYRIVDRYESNV